MEIRWESGGSPVEENSDLIY